MRKHNPRRVHRLAAPPVMVMASAKTEYSIQHYAAIDALVGGWAENDHIVALADMAKTLIFIGEDKRQDNATHAGRTGLAVLSAVVARHKKFAKYGLTGDEIKTLRRVVGFADRYISRQGGAVVLMAEQALARLKKIVIEERVAA